MSHENTADSHRAETAATERLTPQERENKAKVDAFAAEARRRGPLTKVIARAHFMADDGHEVDPGDEMEVAAEELKHRLDAGQITKDLSYVPPENVGKKTKNDKK